LSSFAPDGTVQDIARFDKQTDGRRFHYPSNPAKAIPLVGDPGTEVIAILVGDSMQSIDETLTQVSETASAWPLIPESIVLSLRNGQVLQAARRDWAVDDELSNRLAGSSRKLGEEVEMNPSLAALSERFELLADLCEQRGVEIHAIAFRHLAEESGN